jgi:glycine/D-amino acid oxidase-like deaminating enzyme
MNKPSVIVIGSGVIGLCTAWSLVRAGADVTVVVSQDPQFEIGWGSVAWSNASSKVRLGYPDHYTVLNQRGMTAVIALAEDLDTAPWLHTTGAVELVAGADARDRLEADLRRLGDLDYPAELLDPAAVARILPGVRVGDEESAVLFPTEAWIDVPALLTGLTGATATGGGRFVRGTVTGFDRTAGALTAVLLDDGTKLTADRYVIAAGAWSGKIGTLAGISVPVLPASNAKVPGLVAAVTSPVPGLGPILVAPEIIIRPFGPGRALLASDNHGHELSPDSPRGELFAAAEVLLGRAAARAPQLTGAALLDVRLSLRAIPSDGITIAGVPSGTNNAYVLTTHSGFSLAPLLGGLAASEILGGEQHDLLAPYRPARFAAAAAGFSVPRVDSASASADVTRSQSSRT